MGEESEDTIIIHRSDHGLWLYGRKMGAQPSAEEQQLEIIIHRRDHGSFQGFPFPHKLEGLMGAGKFFEAMKILDVVTASKHTS